MVTKQQRKKRNIEIYKRHLAGESLKSIAESVGLGYDRVAEIVREQSREESYEPKLIKKSEYYVAYAYDPDELKRLVELAISHGYELQGGVSISGGVFAQALIRK